MMKAAEMNIDKNTLFTFNMMEYKHTKTLLLHSSYIMLVRVGNKVRN